MKSINDLWIKGNSFCHLRGYIYESRFLRCLVMVSWQLNSSLFDNRHHPLRCGIVVYLVNPRHLFHSIPLDVCFVSQLEWCCYVSFRELILSCSTFEKVDPSRVSFSSRCHVGWSSQSKTTRQDGDRFNILMKCHLDHEDYTSLCFPFTLPYAWIPGRDFYLVGVSCHIPSSDNA